MSTYTKRRRLRRAPPGFTLVETLVVLAIIALLLGLGLPSYANYGSTQRLRAAVRTLTSDLQVARQEALRQRAAVGVTFSSADAACSAGSAASYTITPTAAPAKRVCLPRHVVWASLPQSYLVFPSTGDVPAGASLRLRSLRTGVTHVVFVAAGTGVITHDAP